MLAVCSAAMSASELAALQKRIESDNSPALICGLSPVHRALVAAAVQTRLFRPVAVLTADELTAASFAADAAALSGIEYGVLPSRELVYHNVGGVSREWEHKRTDVFHRLLRGGLTAVAGSAEAFMLRTIPPEAFAANTVELTLGESYSLTELCSRFERMGYARSELCEGVGQFSVRGGILDVFPPGSPKPARIEFFGDETDSMGYYDPITQRRTENILNIDIPPAVELPADTADGGRAAFAERVRTLLRGLVKAKLPEKLPETIAADAELIAEGAHFTAIDRYLPQLYGEFATALSYLPANAVIFLDDGARVREQIKTIARRVAEDQKQLMASGVISGRQTEDYIEPEALFGLLSARSAVMLDNFMSSCPEMPPREVITLASKQLTSFGGSADALAEEVASCRRAGFSVLLLCSSAARVKYLSSVLEEKGFACRTDYSASLAPEPGVVSLALGTLSSGIELPAAGLTVLTEDRAPVGKRQRRQAKEKDGRERIRSFSDLREGDLIVHDSYGVGRFCGIATINVSGIDKDFIKLAYAGTDVLYIPVTQLDAVSKYLGASEDSAVKLSRLGGTDWSKAKSRAKAAAKDLAKKLIALYAKRRSVKGFAFSPDSEWQKEFEDSFEYEETDDQLIATAEIKKDMESETPMDRLLCGDVGFGKTEVAFRAAMKCIMDGRQVALLVPTTVLARQHYITALRRFRGYPVKIAALSRFTGNAEANETLRKLRMGSVDMLIGTHKLLGKQVKFHDLGLVIVDEEQRFGVSHKEHLKELFGSTDVLTLSATPIPRTLNMALSGVRDMSVLEESPHDRYPVATYVLEYDPAVVADAINRELSRGGQVYYLHNRVETIDKVAAGIAARFPEARVAVGHGKMSQADLNEVMRSVSERESDILVCTTIIEAGIDIPNVNTLIVEDADRLGLAQLHQIRGRVGRSSRHAYAYFTYRRGAALTEISQKRLAAIRDYAEFGAGFKIAMRDLEIRGAGNLLGGEQSGHMVSVGYDMYMRLLEEAVAEEKGETPPPRRECLFDLSLQANIPASYIPSAFERMELYRRIARIETEEDVDDMADELTDRFGAPPHETGTLLRVSLLRYRAAQAGITEVNDKAGPILLYFSADRFDAVRGLFGLPEYRGRLQLNAGDKPFIALRLRGGEAKLPAVEKLIGALEAR